VHGSVYATAVESASSLGATAAVAHRGEVVVGLTNTTHFLRAIDAGKLSVEAVNRPGNCGGFFGPYELCARLDQARPWSRA
jgi:acyl-coenzyme A thioesterase PaaI-like protein